MYIQTLELKHFRCFDSLTLTFDAPMVIIEGANGTGKTSVLEALHYLCFLKSFRTSVPSELSKMGTNNFFVKASFFQQGVMGQELHDLSIGFMPDKRLVKLDGVTIKSYKQLLEVYRIITLTQDDLDLIKGEPQSRRSFIDHVILLIDPSYAQILRTLRHILAQRTSLLRSPLCDRHSYEAWSAQLWTLSREIMQRRETALAELAGMVNELVRDFLPEPVSITFTYRPRKEVRQDSFEAFLMQNPRLYDKERLLGRSLFGPQLDDIIIHFEEKMSRAYASRGQQKLIITLLKLAQLLTLKRLKGNSILLLDDFITDFDEKRVNILLTILESIDSQVIFTIPSLKVAPVKGLTQKNACIIKLTG